MAWFSVTLASPRSGFSASLAVLTLAFAPLATAAETEGPEIALRAGEAGSDYERAGLGLRFDPVWSRDWGNWMASLRPELEFSHFRYTGPAAGPDSLNQIGGIGVFHLHYGTSRFRPYAEAGLGAALFSRDQLGTKQFSARFQFSEHLALGVEWTGHGFAGVQYSHYSNADIEKPNDGLDVQQIVIGAHF